VAGHPADAGPSPDGAGPSPDGARPVSVLLAEHEPEVAVMSARFLSRDGLRVRLVTRPDQVLAELTGGQDAAAVVDLTMPGLDARRIRRALRTPVIFLVADLRAPRPRGLAARGDATGARRWLARPFSPRQLVAMVREVLAQTGPASTGELADAAGRERYHHRAGLQFLWGRVARRRRPVPLRWLVAALKGAGNRSKSIENR